MEKVFGAEERHDSLIRLGTNRAVLIYGHGDENGMGYDYRHTFDHIPTEDEVLEVITTHVNGLTDLKILSGYVWNGNKVWLSTENQFNFKAAYDVAVQTGGATLPIKFKLGESDGEPNYYVFEDMATFTDFYTKALAFIIETLNVGWLEKDEAKEWVSTLGLNGDEK